MTGAVPPAPAWLVVDDPAAAAGRVLAAEAPDIPRHLVTCAPWRQQTMATADLDVDEEMVARHDADRAHRERRDRVLAEVRSGTPLPPLVALGPRRRLVDGYARIRALRLLGVTEASVLIQDVDDHG